MYLPFNTTVSDNDPEKLDNEVQTMLIQLKELHEQLHNSITIEGLPEETAQAIKSLDIHKLTCSLVTFDNEHLYLSVK